MGTHVSAEQITFENAAGERAIVKLSSLAGPGPKPKDRNGLLLWGVFYQLVELNQRLGTCDLEAKTGSGITGLLAQVAATNRDTVAELEKLASTMRTLADQAATAQANQPTPEAAMNQAFALMRKFGMDTPPGVPGAERSGGNGAGD